MDPLARRVAARFVANLAGTELATEFPSQEALDKYLKEHPKADKSKHTVKKEDGEEREREDSPTGAEEDDDERSERLHMYRSEWAEMLDSGEDPTNLLKEHAESRGRREDKAQELYKEVKKRRDNDEISDDDFNEFDEAYESHDFPRPRHPISGR